MQEFDGKVAVITGAASGIGKSLAAAAAARGMKLVLADIDLPSLEEVAPALDAETIARKIDVGQLAQIEALRDDALAKFGGVHLLCNNAGVVPGGRHRMVWEFEPQDWEWAFQVNVLGLANGIRAFIPGMIDRREPGHVLNTTSIAGFMSGSQTAAYGASKHAAVRISEALLAGLRDVGAPIGVTMLAPGIVATRIYDSERNRPDDLRGSRDSDESEELSNTIADLYQTALQPDDVAKIAFDAIVEDQFYTLTSSAYDEEIAKRTAPILDRRNPEFASLKSLTTADAKQ